jgi:hypothetical protein
MGLPGAGGGNRTLTVSPPPDFESGASTNSATPAPTRKLNVLIERFTNNKLKQKLIDNISYMFSFWSFAGRLAVPERQKRLQCAPSESSPPGQEQRVSATGSTVQICVACWRQPASKRRLLACDDGDFPHY